MWEIGGVKFLMTWIKVMVVVCCVASCGSSDKTAELVTEFEENLASYQTLVLSVDDEPSAAAVSARLTTMGEELEQLAAQLAESKPLDEEQRQELKAEIVKQFSMHTRVTTEVSRRWIGDQKVMKIMGKALEDYGSKVRMVESVLIQMGIDPATME